MISSGLTGWLGIWVQSKKKAGKGCIILCVCVNVRVCVCCVVCVRMFVYCTNVRGCACLWHCVCVNVCFCASANLCRLKFSPPQHIHLLLRLALVFIIVCCLESIHMKSLWWNLASYVTQPTSLASHVTQLTSTDLITKILAKRYSFSKRWRYRQYSLNESTVGSLGYVCMCMCVCMYVCVCVCVKERERERERGCGYVCVSDTCWHFLNYLIESLYNPQLHPGRRLTVLILGGPLLTSGSTPASESSAGKDIQC